MDVFDLLCCWVDVGNALRFHKRKEIYQSTGTGNHRINLQNIAEGVYLINISFENRVFTKEIVVKRK